MEEKNKEIRCWICGRSEDEIRKDTRDLDLEFDLDKAKKNRAKYDTYNRWLEGKEKSLIHLGDGEFIGAGSVPLCVVCQSLLLSQAQSAAYREIDNQVADGELMGAPSEYRIVPKEPEVREAGLHVKFLSMDKGEEEEAKEVLKELIAKHLPKRSAWMVSRIEIEEGQ